MTTIERAVELNQLLSRIQSGELRSEPVERRKILARATGLLAFSPTHRANAMQASDILGQPGYSSSMYERMEGRMETILGQAITELECPTGPLHTDPLQPIRMLCDRFHVVCRQLRSRHESRPTLDVQDEYDVQDLLHALLALHCDDIRTEEWTPSYAGRSARMDFLLKQERIVVEVKKARRGLGAREIGDQLIEDVSRYQSHPDCVTLVCFVYDPDGLIANPRGIENDLRRVGESPRVEVWIRP
jgi:hypothetical protein